MNTKPRFQIPEGIAFEDTISRDIVELFADEAFCPGLVVTADQPGCGRSLLVKALLEHRFGAAAWWGTPHNDKALQRQAVSCDREKRGCLWFEDVKQSFLDRIYLTELIAGVGIFAETPVPAVVVSGLSLQVSPVLEGWWRVVRLKPEH